MLKSNEKLKVKEIIIIDDKQKVDREITYVTT